MSLLALALRSRPRVASPFRYPAGNVPKSSIMVLNDRRLTLPHPEASGLAWIVDHLECSNESRHAVDSPGPTVIALVGELSATATRRAWTRSWRCSGEAVDVSVILATWRRPTLLARTLESLKALRSERLTGELLVVDNADDPETQAVVSRASGPLPIRLLIEPERGKSRALNRALPEARGRLLVFTDDDIVADPGWLVELAAGAQRWPHHAVFGGRVLPLWPAGRRPPAEHPFLAHAYAIADWPRPEGTYDAGYVFGPNMAVRASALRAGRRFDPAVGPDGTRRYVPGAETELLRRLEHAGLGAVYLPRALVFHQIRPEQLEARWLFGRAFRKGRWDLRKQGAPAGPRLGGLSRSLLGRALRACLRLAAARLAGDRRACFEHGLAYWHTRGMIYECRGSSLQP